MRVYFIGATPQARVYKQVTALKKCYKELKISLVCYRYDKVLLEDLFDEVIILKNSDPKIELDELFKLDNIDVVHCFSDKFAMVKPIIDSKIPFVFDPYDYFLTQVGIEHSILMEQWQEIVYNTQALLVRYDKSIYKNHEFKLFDTSNTLIEQMYDFCLPELFVEKSLEDMMEKSIVHIGYVSALELDKKLFSPTQFDTVAKNLLDSGFSYHIYSSLWSDSFEKLCQSYRIFLEKYRAFDLFPAHAQKELNPLISKYKYGSYLHDIEGYDSKSPYIVDSVGNKVFNYLEATLPILSTEEFKAVCRVIEEFDIGVNIGKIEQFSVKTSLFENSYERHYSKVIDIRENELNIYNHIHKIYNLYKEIK